METKQNPTFWAARDKDGWLWLFEDKPVREGTMWDIGSKYSESFNFGFFPLFPDLKWEDEPIEVELTIKKK